MEFDDETNLGIATGHRAADGGRARRTRLGGRGNRRLERNCAQGGGRIPSAVERGQRRKNRSFGSLLGNAERCERRPEEKAAGVVLQGSAGH